MTSNLVQDMSAVAGVEIVLKIYLVQHMSAVAGVVIDLNQVIDLKLKFVVGVVVEFVAGVAQAHSKTVPA